MTSAFREAVLDVVCSIPSGRVMSYGAVAKHAGYRGWARQVGSCLWSQASMESCPWWRVVGHDGKILARIYKPEQHKRLMQEGVGFMPDEPYQVQMECFRHKP